MRPDGSGEIRVRAGLVGDHEFVLDPPLALHQVTVPVREVESTIPCGFQSEWGSGELPDGTPFTLACGAGWGSRWATLVVGKGDARREFCIDGAELVRAITEAVS